MSASTQAAQGANSVSNWNTIKKYPPERNWSNVWFLVSLALSVAYYAIVHPYNQVSEKTFQGKIPVSELPFPLYERTQDIKNIYKHDLPTFITGEKGVGKTTFLVLYKNYLLDNNLPVLYSSMTKNSEDKCVQFAYDVGYIVPFNWKAPNTYPRIYYAITKEEIKCNFDKIFQKISEVSKKKKKL